jgi:hypothetical protein
VDLVWSEDPDKEALNIRAAHINDLRGVKKNLGPLKIEFT